MQFTIAQVLDAIEQNGYRKAVGALYRNRHGNVDQLTLKPISACAVGQGAINLNTRPENLSDSLKGVRVFIHPDNKYHTIPAHAFLYGRNDLYSMIFRINDETRRTVPEVAQEVRSKLDKSVLDTVISVPRYEYPWKKGK